MIALDEPTTAMDAIAKRAFWEIVRSATLNRSILLTVSYYSQLQATGHIK